MCTTRLAAVALLCAAAGQAWGQIDLRLDMSTLISSTPGNWNNITNLAGTTNNLIDFPTGANTGVSITAAGPWQDFFGDDFGAFPNASWLIQPATRDGAGLQNNLTGTFRFAGLPTGPYRVEIVSARTTFEYLNTITIGGVLANRTFRGTPVNTPWNSTTDGLTPGNWLIWDNVQTPGGFLSISNTSGPNTLGIINAIRVFQIPTPGAIATLAAAIVIAARRRR